LLLSTSSVLVGQTRKIDSLKALIVHTKEDTSMVLSFVKLAAEYREKDKAKAINYGKKAINLSEKLQWRKGSAIANSFLGRLYAQSAEYQMAIKHLRNSVNEWQNYKTQLINEEKKNDTEYSLAESQLYKVYATLGSAYMNTGDYNTAQQYYLDAIKISDRLGDTTGSAENLVRIGIIQEETGELDKSLKNYTKALEMFRQLNNNTRIALTLGNIGNVYYSKRDFKNAKVYYLNSLRIHEEEKDLEGVNYGLGYMGGLYFAEATEAKSSGTEAVDSLLKNSIDYFSRALKISREADNKKLTAIWLGSLGQVYLFMKDFNNAKDYLEQAIKLTDELGTLNEKMQYEYSLSELYEMKGDYKTANTYYTHYITIKDFLFNTEKKDQLVKQELNYEFEKKEEMAKAEQVKKDAVTEAERKDQQLILIIICSVLALMAVFAVFIYRALSLAKKQKSIIERKAKETNTQREVIEQKNKDITDSIRYAKRIQQSLLPHEIFIERAFGKLKNNNSVK
ncbi:MAG: tetratricopeptide repeat protein, partial [Bacteroidia bacterium]